MRISICVFAVALMACGGDISDDNMAQLDPYQEAAQYGICPSGSWVCNAYMPYVGQGWSYWLESAATGCYHSHKNHPTYPTYWQTKGNGCLSGDYRTYVYDRDMYDNWSFNGNCATFAKQGWNYPNGTIYTDMPASGHCYWYGGEEDAWVGHYFFEVDNSTCTGSVTCGEDGV